jgi:hypothetical protein
MNEELGIKALLLSAKKSSPKIYGTLSNTRPTMQEVEIYLSKQKSVLTVLLILTLFPGICLFTVLPYIYWVFLPKLRVFKAAQKLYEVLYAEDPTYLEQHDDPECSHLALRGDIERILKSIPKGSESRADELLKQLEQTTQQWRNIQTKLNSLDGKFPQSEEQSLVVKHRNLLERIGRETDPVSLSSLQSQLAAVEGQLKSGQNLRMWRIRLRNAQDASTEGLKQLRASLVLQFAAGNFQNTISEDYIALQTLNSRLSAAQQAEEEIALV